MLQGVRAQSPYLSHSLEWTKAHPERKKPEHTWTPADIGIHTADLIAGDPAILALRHPNLPLTTVDTDQVHLGVARFLSSLYGLPQASCTTLSLSDLSHHAGHTSGSTHTKWPMDPILSPTHGHAYKSHQTS
jgi:hypothetical protein